ncbi:MAG: polysaccharide biosynthesis tyrosine autokinase [Xenococcaceae cyanobacterium MO_188.B19]|nr:polysaccharide biosynthesis tyrosine autokinase [Xenococcaceae cyanobacterium MO_188.B19]
MSNGIIRPDTVHLPQEEPGFSLSDIKQIIYRKWKPALAVTIVAFAGIFASEALKTPKYKSETLILLENSKTQNSTSIAPGGNQGFTGYYNLKDFSTEIYVLRSYSLVSQAAQKLKLRYSNITPGEIISSLSIRQASVNEVPTDVLIVSYTNSDPEKAKAVLEALGETYVDYSLERQRAKASNAILFIDNQLPNAQKELDKTSMAIRDFRRKYSLVDPDTHAEAVTKYKLSLEQESNGLQLDLQRLKNLKIELESRLIKLGQDPETIAASSTLSQDSVYQKLASQLKDIEANYALGKINFHDTYHVMEELKLQQQELRQLLNKRAREILGKSASPEIQQKVLIATNSTTVKSDSRTPTTKNSQPGTSNNSILENLSTQLVETKTQLAVLEKQKKSLANIQKEVDSQFQLLPQLQQDYSQLQREYAVKSEAVDYLLKRQQELEIAEAEANAPWRVLNAPYLPSKPVSPNIQNSLSRALMLSGLLGIATAFLLQKLDQRVRKVEEIKQITRLPILGTIPRVENPMIETVTSNRKSSYSYYYSSFTEGLRALAMNLRYIVTETGRIKSLALTSSTSSEGKTTISYNLGVVLTELGLKVLVVDGDMRKPKIHKIAQIKNERGLSDIIANNESWTDLINTEILENLHVLTAGSNNPNPIALLNSEKMTEMIAEWEEEYDYVLIDTPPIGVMADAKSLATEVDSFLFVTGIERATRKGIINALDILGSSNCHMAGFVANMVDRDFDYYAYSYYDSYYNQQKNAGTTDNGTNMSEGNESQGRLQQIVRQFRRR